jgi:hypothetical protein
MGKISIMSEYEGPKYKARSSVDSPLYWAQNRWITGIFTDGDYIEVGLDRCFFRVWGFHEPALGDTYYFTNIRLQVCDQDGELWRAVVLMCAAQQPDGGE